MHSHRKRVTVQPDITTLLKMILDYFPMRDKPRDGQSKALSFIERMVREGVTDIIVEAPTGAGKSAIGAACCYWSADWDQLGVPGAELTTPGGYYLVTQKELQRQIKDDVRINYARKDFASLWSSASYMCDGGSGFRDVDDNGELCSMTCQTGMRSKVPKCDGRKNKTCPYLLDRDAFVASTFALTNYPFFLTERFFSGQLPRRRIMILDECHTVEKQLLKYGEVEISDKSLHECQIRSISTPEFDRVDDFVKWLDGVYLPVISDKLADEIKSANMAGDDVPPALAARITFLQNQVRKTEGCISGVRTNPSRWVYWCDQTENEGNICYCKPLDASPFMRLLSEGAAFRVYMSAFPGEKKTFCESLGLDHEAVARIRVPSTFPKENRPILIAGVGSMSRKYQSTTLPAVTRTIAKVFEKHKDQKGLIHCHSYDIGKAIYAALKSTGHGDRILFPTKAEDRESAVKTHKESSLPTVLISPSITEGFDFKGDTGRWQVIAKIPYPYLGDRQVEAKRDISQEWYDLQTIMTIVQSAGRICRSEDDWGITYIMDDDFKRLYEKRGGFFPSWFKDAVVWA